MSVSSYRARWNGVDYPATPEARMDGLWMRLRSTEPVDGYERSVDGRFVRVVPAAECELLEAVTTVCEWRGAPCVVRAQRDDEVLVEYTGGLAPVARELGMERHERGVYRAWVPSSEIEGRRENAVPFTA